MNEQPDKYTEVEKEEEGKDTDSSSMVREDTPQAHWNRFQKAVRKAVTMPKEELAARVEAEKKRKRPSA